MRLRPAQGWETAGREKKIDAGPGMRYRMGMEETPFVRVFVSLAISGEVRAALAELQERARHLRVRIGWIRPENLHVTLSFLGDVPREAIPALADSLDSSVRSLEPFTFETAGLGWFGGRHPCVWWAGVTPGPGADAIGRLAGVVSETVRSVGYPDDAKEVFVPHVTLGRTRPGADPVPLMRFLESRYGKESFGVSSADRIALMQSVLGSTGPQYTVLSECRLGA